MLGRNPLGSLDLYGLGRVKGLQQQLLDVALYTSSATITLTTGYQDITGVTTGSFTPAVNEIALVWLTVDFNFTGGTAAMQVGDALLGVLDLFYSSADHLSTTPVAINVPGSAAVGTVMNSGYLSGTQFYALPLTAGTAYIIKAQTKNSSGARGRSGTYSQMVVWRLAA